MSKSKEMNPHCKILETAAKLIQANQMLKILKTKIDTAKSLKLLEMMLIFKILSNVIKS